MWMSLLCSDGLFEQTGHGERFHGLFDSLIYRQNRSKKYFCLYILRYRHEPEGCKEFEIADHTGNNGRIKSFTCTFYVFARGCESGEGLGGVGYTGKNGRIKSITCTFCVSGKGCKSSGGPGTADYTGKIRRKRYFTCTCRDSGITSHGTCPYGSLPATL